MLFLLAGQASANDVGERLDQIGKFHLGQPYDAVRSAAGLPKLKEVERALSGGVTRKALGQLGVARLSWQGDPNTTFSMHLDRLQCELIFGPVAQPDRARGEGEAGLCGFNFSLSASGVYEVSMVFARLHVADRPRFRGGYVKKLGQHHAGGGAQLIWFGQRGNNPFRIEYVEDGREGVYRIMVASEDMREGARRRGQRVRGVLASNAPIRNLLPVLN